MTRPDLVFEKNRAAAAQRRKQQRRRRSRQGCLALLILLPLLAVVWAWRFREETATWVRRATPWLQTRARAAMGEISLVPYFAVIEASDLSALEKEEWTRMMERAWARAEESGWALMRRSEIIEQARAVVESPPGLYYALRVLQEQGLDHAELDAERRRLGLRLMEEARAALREGRMPVRTREMLKGHIHSLLIDARGGLVAEREVRQAAERSRVFLSDLHAERRDGAWQRSGDRVDMASRLRGVLREMRREMDKGMGTNTTPFER